jgi:hypothetical protein
MTDELELASDFTATNLKVLIRKSGTQVIAAYESSSLAPTTSISVNCSAAAKIRSGIQRGRESPSSPIKLAR